MSWEATEKSRLYLTLSFESSLERMRIWGRQFLVCGGPSSRRRRLKRAAERARPRRPSPHSFSALEMMEEGDVILLSRSLHGLKSG